MSDNFSYQLVGGQPVVIETLEVSASGTYYAPDGHAYNPVVCSVAGALEEKSVTLTENGTSEISPSKGKEGLSKVNATVSVPSYLSTLSSPYGAANGAYILTATDDQEDTVCGICVLVDGTIAASYGDGSFEIDESGDAPTLAWTPSVTAVSVVCWYAASVAD